MKKQYLARTQQRHQEARGAWTNAVYFFASNKRYADSYEEAKAAIDKMMTEFNGKGARTEKSTVAGFGISYDISPEEANNLEVVRWEILEREVSEWQKVSE